MTSAQLLERLVKCLEGAQAHLLTPNARSLEWWLKLDAHVSDIVGTWLLLTPTLLRATFARAHAEATAKAVEEGPGSPQEAPKAPGAPTVAPQAPKPVREAPRTPEMVPKGRYIQGAPVGMGFLDPSGKPAEPACPVCQSRVIDGRLTKRSKKAPDFKCGSKTRPPCPGVWHPGEFQKFWEAGNAGDRVPAYYVSDAVESLERTLSATAWHLVIPVPDKEVTDA